MRLCRVGRGAIGAAAVAGAIPRTIDATDRLRRSALERVYAGESGAEPALDAGCRADQRNGAECACLAFGRTAATAGVAARPAGGAAPPAAGAADRHPAAAQLWLLDDYRARVGS